MVPINCVWIGNKLSIMEILSIKLAQKAGFEVTLWTCSDSLNVPQDTIVKKVPQNFLQPIGYQGIFQTTLPNGGIGSFSHWSDYFAFKTLYETGGYWMQLDLAIIKKLDIKKSYAFAPWGPGIAPIFMKLPPNSEFAKKMVEVLEEMVKTGLQGQDWHLAMNAMNHYAQIFNIYEDCDILREGYADCGGGAPSPYNTPDNKEYTMIHWSNATYNHVKEVPLLGTIYHKLCVENGLV